MEELLKEATLLLATFAEACAGVVIGYAVFRAAIFFVLNVFRGPPGTVPNESIRLSLGRSLTLGLEFLLGADILKTAIAPTWEQIGLLAAIAAIRTGLNYFLQKELERAAALEERRQAQKVEILPVREGDSERAA